MTLYAVPPKQMMVNAFATIDLPCGSNCAILLPCPSNLRPGLGTLGVAHLLPSISQPDPPKKEIRDEFWM